MSDSLCKMVNPCSESEAKIPGKDVAKTEHQENKAPMSALSRQSGPVHYLNMLTDIDDAG